MPTGGGEKPWGCFLGKKEEKARSPKKFAFLGSSLPQRGTFREGERFFHPKKEKGGTTRAISWWRTIKR